LVSGSCHFAHSGVEMTRALGIFSPRISDPTKEAEDFPLSRPHWDGRIQETATNQG
jgi:hypothetical protein